VSYVVIRSYSGQGASALFDVIEQRESEVKDIIGGVPGFISYAAIRTSDGGTTATICEDKTGTDESTRRAAQWVKDNATETVQPPVITEGEAFIQF
jgi:hypothetical protein